MPPKGLDRSLRLPPPAPAEQAGACQHCDHPRESGTRYGRWDDFERETLIRCRSPGPDIGARCEGEAGDRCVVIHGHVVQESPRSVPVGNIKTVGLRRNTYETLRYYCWR